jgi:hypothetical protein
MFYVGGVGGQVLSIRDLIARPLSKIANLLDERFTENQ